MKTSVSVEKIAPALVKAQKAMNSATKNSKNPHFKNTYADLSAVIDAVKEALNDNGIVFLQTPIVSDDNKLHLTTRLLHESGEWIENTCSCPLPKQDPQGFGSALTYLRRYNLSAICGLSQEDDDGENAKQSEKSLLENVVSLNKYLLEIANAYDLELLKTIYIEAVKECGNNTTSLKSLELAKDKRKAELTNA